MGKSRSNKKKLSSEGDATSTTGRTDTVQIKSQESSTEAVQDEKKSTKSISKNVKDVVDETDVMMDDDDDDQKSADNSMVEEEEEEEDDEAPEGSDTLPETDITDSGFNVDDSSFNVDRSTSEMISNSDGRYRNKQRCLTLCSRGVTARYRHLLEDLRTLIPHHKKESKLDYHANEEHLSTAVNQIASLRSCNTILLLECKKRKDAFMWLGNSHNGPSAKFLITNIHTMDELRLTGNCMKYSRPIITFDESFDRLGHLQLLKELFTDIFNTPRGHPKSKPFIDHVISFYYADHRIWFRHYQILEQKPENGREAHQEKLLTGKKESLQLIEIGPRFTLEPIRIFRGTFGGQTLYQNPQYVSPNEIRSAEKRKQGRSYEQRKEAEHNRKERSKQIVVPKNPLDDVFTS